MNRFRLASICFVTLVFAPILTFAQGGPPAGTPGADVNLSTRVAALEARVAKLESGQVTESDLVGSYVFQLFGVETQGSAAGGVVPRLSTEAGGVIFRFNANKTVSLTSIGGGRCTLTTFAGGIVTCAADEQGSADPAPGVAWSVSNGKLVVTEEGDEPMELLIGAGGRVLIGGGTSTGEPNHGWSAIAILSRLPNS